MPVKVGDKAPEFSLLNQNAEKVSISDFKDQNIVLYFYPKNNTSGCTKEACNFRDEFPKFGKLEA
ncbi:MAG: redoxin domain-containing protein, partial [Ignavibacteriaceae bacterium]